MTKDVPLERDYKHWKSKYEMEQHAHEQTKQSLAQEARGWQQHAINLGSALAVLSAARR